MISDFRTDGGAPRYFGVFPAIVADLVDPDRLGRIQLKFPWLGSEGADVRAWSTLLTPYADDDQGFQVLPEVDTQVVVAFEAGELRRPYIVGSCWNGCESMPESPAAPNNKRLIKTRSGSLLEFDDTEGAAKVTLSMKSGHKLVLDDASQEVKLTHSNGCLITFTAGGQIQVQANSTVEITASAVNVHAAAANFDGIVTCTTLIASSCVVSPSYTPGAGNMVNGHPWKLVGPWYRWTVPGGSRVGRESRPALQKFSGGDFVNEFLRQPQHSLKFDPLVDQVYDVNYAPLPPLLGSLLNKRATLFPADEQGNTSNPQRVTLSPRLPGGLRKLFLDSHDRHYLVTCELHCDVPGFPSAQGDEVCQMGFVVRRRYLEYPEAAVPIVRPLLRDIIRIQGQLSELDETSPLRPRATKRRAGRNEEMRRAGTFDAARAAVVAALGAARVRLEQWKTDNGVRSVLQGWVASTHPRLGAWQVVDDEPEELIEASFPMHKVFADPAFPDHDAQGRTLYFGVVPTGSLDSEAGGKSRFDDTTTYEIRCFVRRHKTSCPRRQPPPDCCGPLTWSRPTEPYRLASQFDLEGTSNRPITIQMPNLAELAAQVVAKPFGKYSPVKFIQPQGLNPILKGKGVDNGRMSGFQICFFSIPLITIIALFVLQIFLPVVVLIFNLWFLLAFKFCIPPSLSIAGGVDAKLKAIGPSIDADFSVAVDINSDGVLEANALAVRDVLAGVVAGDLAASHGIPVGDVSAGLTPLANSPLAALNASNAGVAGLPSTAKDDPSIGVDYQAGLEFEVHRDPEAGV